MIILYGGSFDPVHRGHVETARATQTALPGARLVWVPAARSPLKPGMHTGAEDRLAMLRQATADEPTWSVDAHELHVPPPSYTIDTLRRWRARIGPDQPLAFLMGRDSFDTLTHWRDWQHLTTLAHLVVASRPGSEGPVPTALATWLESRQIFAAGMLQSSPFGQVLMLPTPAWPVSSTALRHALAHGAPVGDWLTPAVAEHIAAHALYRSPESPASP